MGDFTGYCLQLQGFSIPKEDCVYYSYAARFTPLLNALIIVAGILMHSYLVFATLALILLVGVLFPSHSVFDGIVFNRILSPLLRLKPLPPTPAPRRFAMAMGVILSLLAAGAFYFGQMLAGYSIASFMLLASLVIVISNWCLGSWVYGFFAKASDR